MTNKASSFPAAPQIGPLHRYGGRITALGELPIHALGDSYTVDGNGIILALPTYQAGATIFLTMAGTPTFVNSRRLICPANENYSALAGDLVIARSKDDGVWQLYVLRSAGDVTSLNGLTGDLSIVPGPGVSVSAAGSTIAISNSMYTLPAATTSGSGSNTTGTISAVSPTLTLAAAIDFANGQGIRINHAGAAFTLNPPTSASVTPTGTAGSTAYAYTIASLNATGGVGQSITNVTTATGNATLSSTNYNTLSWTAATGTAPAAYAIYGNKAGSLVLIGITNGTTFSDTGAGAITAPDWLPTTPQTSASLASWLITTISSGAGTTTLTLAANATTAATSQFVIHDDTASLQAWITSAQAAGNKAFLPPGSYQTTSALAIAGRIKIEGAGYQGDSGGGYAGNGVTQSSGFAGSVIVCGIFNAAFVATTNLAVQMFDFQITYPVQPIPGTVAITIQAVAGAGNSNTQSAIQRLMITGHYYGIEMINALDFDISHNKILYGWGGGILANSPNYPSYNQALIAFNLIWGNGGNSAISNAYAFHIEVQAGGDLRIIGNKGNAGGPNTNGISLLGAPSGSQNMEPMVIVGNTIEGCQNAICASTANASFGISQVVITGNQLWGAGKSILVNSFGTANWFAGFTITGNVLTVNGGASKLAVQIDNAANGVITGNTYNLAGGGSASTGLLLGPNTTNVNVQSNVYNGGYTTKVNNTAGAANTVGGGSS